MISIFKTNVTNQSEVEILQPQLDKHLNNFKWNFDLEDCDSVLRIDSQNQVTELIAHLLQENGFNCEELS